jgi:8-amino-7-oxononanoate synthase
VRQAGLACQRRQQLLDANLRGRVDQDVGVGQEVCEGLERRGFAVVSAQPLPEGGNIVTPIVPVLIGDDWKAALIWRALFDEGVLVNLAVHPAVPPGGALLRTSLMATHDRGTLERALDAFSRVKARFEAEHGPLPAPGEHDSRTFAGADS